MRKRYTPLAVLRIWRHGCGNTIPFHQGPWRCWECTRAMLVAFARSCLTPWNWTRYPMPAKDARRG